MAKKLLYFFAFFISGLSAIIYQILWIRLLSLAFGGVTLVTAAVSGLFLLGLALGSLLGGKIIDRLVGKTYFKRIYWFYITVEIVIAVLGVINWKLFTFFSFIPGQWRIFASGLLIILQSSVCGATWPIMFKLLLSLGEKWNVSGKISFINTLGAAVGAFLAGFLIIANIGITGAVFVALLANLLVAVIIFFSGKPTLAADSLNCKVNNEGRDFKFTLAVFSFLFIAGFVGMAMEILWMRSFTLVFGNSVYSFTLVLTVILLGLALGGLVSQFKKFRLVGINSLFWILWFEALFIFLSMVILPKVPYFIISWYSKTGNSFIQAQLLRITMVLLISFIPSFLSGILLPLGVMLLKSRYGDSGRQAGTAYFVNTIGAVCGGFLAAVFLIPKLGLQTAILSVGFLSLIVVGLFMKQILSFRYILIVFISILLAFWGYKVWDKQDLTSGAYLYGPSVLGKTSGRKLLYYKDGRETTVTAFLHKGTTALALNGKVDASDNLDMGTEAVLGHVPVLLIQNPKNALVIGLGSGITAGAISRHQKVEKITVVEIEKSVAEVADKYFNKENYDVLKNPKTRLVINDARNFLLNSSEKFDVITSEPSNPWIAGEANLFTKEFFEIGKNHLTEEGVFFQWLHLYNLRPDEVKSIIRTFSSVFPYVKLWTSTNPSDIFLSGKNLPFNLSWNRFEEGLNIPEVRKSLERRGFADETRLLSLLWAKNDVVRQLAQGGQINTDQRPTLEYLAPLGLYENTLPENLSLLLEYFEEDKNILEIDGMPKEEVEKLEKARKERRLFIQGREAYEKGDLASAVALAEEGQKFDSEGPSLKRFLSQLYTETGVKNKDTGYFEKAIKLNNSFYPAYTESIQAFLASNNLEKAEEIIKDGKEKFPWSGEIVMYEGILKGIQGDDKQSEELLIKAKDLEDWNVLIYNNLAHLYYSQGKKDLAVIKWKESLKLNPSQPKIKEMLSLTERLTNFK